MNNFEGHLQRQPIRPLPAAWRGEILAQAAKRVALPTGGPNPAVRPRPLARLRAWPAPWKWAAVVILAVVLLVALARFWPRALPKENVAQKPPATDPLPSVPVETDAFLARPAPPPRELPGTVDGRLTDRWIAPYVLATESVVGGKSIHEVRWFGPNGAVLRDLREGHPMPSDGFVESRQGNVSTYYGTTSPWVLTLPTIPEENTGEIDVSPDGATLVHSWTAKDGKYYAEVYVDGKSAAKMGPYFNYELGNFAFGMDGSLAVLVRKTAQSQFPTIVALAPGGKEVFEADCGGDVMIAGVAPGGRGVVVEGNGALFLPEDTYGYFTKAGLVNKLKIQYNAELTGWLPDSATALYVCSLDRESFKLVDWEKGVVLWSVEDPLKSPLTDQMRGTAIEGGYVLLSGAETGADGLGHLAVNALDLADGHLVATWTSSDTTQPRPANFMRVGGKLYLMTNDLFAPVSIESIKTKTNGWH